MYSVFHHKSAVGAKLARDSGGSVCIDAESAAAIAGKPCSHVGHERSCIRCFTTSPLWEQSLLAIAVGQLALMLKVRPPSRASLAPTWGASAHVFGVHHKSAVVAELAPT